MICGSRCSKSSLAKAAGAFNRQMKKMARRCGTKRIFKSKRTKYHTVRPIFEGQMSKNGTRLWHEAHLQVKIYKIPQSRSNFGSSDVQKPHATVAQSAFINQNAWNTICLDHFLKVRCSKIARRCGAKHICKSKWAKSPMFGPLFEGQISKNVTRLWRKTHL